jgi:hypothetical protein
VHASEEPDDYRRTSLAPVGVRRRTTRPPALVVDDDDDDLPVDEADAGDGEVEPDAAPGATDEPDAANAVEDAEPDAGNTIDEPDAVQRTTEAMAQDEADQVTTELDLRQAERPAAPE